MSFLIFTESEMINQAVVARTQVRVGVMLMQFILGIGLLFGANGLAGFLKKLQPGPPPAGPRRR